MDIPEEFFCDFIDDDASQLELALKYAPPERETTKKTTQKKERKKRLTRRKKKCTIPESEWIYSCEKCKKRFPTEPKLNKHQHNAHLPVKYDCPVCGKQFTRRDLLKDHENTHSEEPLFQCERCKKLFRKNSCLKQHERKHERDDRKNGLIPPEEPIEPPPVKVRKKRASKYTPITSNETQKKEENRSHSPTLGNIFPNFGVVDFKIDNVPKPAFDLIFRPEDEKDEFESFKSLTNSVMLEDEDKEDDDEGEKDNNNKDNEEDGLSYCEKCRKFFPTKERLRKHLRNAHLSGKYRCPVCDKLFTRRDLCKDHIYTHTGEKKYQCTYKHCKKSFYMVISLRQHEKIHKRKRKNSNTSFDSDDDDMSESDEHKCCSRTACLEHREPEPPKSNTPSPYGLKEFIEEDAAEMELALELGTTEDICENEENEENNEEREGREEGEEFICFHCFRKFDSHEDMLVHIEDEHFTFVCETCNKQFPTDKRLKKHQRDAHLSGKFRCPICDKLFTRKDLCKDHVYTHSAKPLFKCKFDNCQKTFSKPFSLKQHEKIHTNSNRRTCPICNESVVQLSKHMNSHLKTKQYPCRSCDKSFTRLNYLQEHEKIHLGEKGFVCDECNVEFKSSNVLYKHKRSKHAKEKYVCEVSGCGQEFNRKDNMTTHMRRVHKLKVETVRKEKNNKDKETDDSA